MVWVPFPIWPLLFSPQQYADPAAVIPQVCVVPVLSDFQVWPPATEVGDEAPEFVPFPNCPYAFEPQQYATESADIPHVCEAPEEISAYATPRENVGVEVIPEPVTTSKEPVDTPMTGSLVVTVNTASVVPAVRSSAPLARITDVIDGATVSRR